MRHIHLMIDNFYSKKLIEVINNNFPSNDHFFIIISPKGENSIVIPDTFKVPDTTENVKYFYLSGSIISIIKRFFYSKVYKKIRKLMQDAEHIYIHALTNDAIQILYRFKKGPRFISWIVWGADLYSHIPVELYDPKTKVILSSINLFPILLITEQTKIKTILSSTNRKLKTKKSIIIELMVWIYLQLMEKRRKKIIKNFNSIYFHLKTEIDILKKYYKINGRTFSGISYPLPINFKELNLDKKIDEKYNFKKEFSKLVLLGNSGAPTNNHIDILYDLAEIYDEDFGIVCPVSYGVYPAYNDELIRIGKSLFKERFIPLKEFLDQETYFYILNKQIDVAILNHNRPQGLATLYLLLFLKKIIYLKKTPTYDHLIEKGLQLFTIDELREKIQNRKSIFEINGDLEMNKMYTCENITQEKSISYLKRIFYK